jgi:DNA mismatch endonuclease (patch repair protein)
LRYRLNVVGLPGKPDIVFPAQRLAVFCDGDFWHGRNLRGRLSKLKRGHNASYWLAKIKGNVLRDRRQTRALEAAGWQVLRVWETDVLTSVDAIAGQISDALDQRKAVSRRG